MAGNLSYIDSDVEERRSDSFDPLPDGWYGAQIIESDVVDTKAGTGKLAKFTLEIIDGPFSRRRVWDQMNVQNRSPEAQRIGQQQLRQLAEALGFAWPLPAGSSTASFEFKPVEIRVGRRKDDREKNEVKAYRAYSGAQGQPQRQPAPAAQSRPAPQQQVASGGNSRPWR